MINKIICQRIYDQTMKLGWSSADFSKALYGNANSSNRSKTNKWMNGKSVPKETEIPKIAEVLRLHRSLFTRFRRNNIC